MRRWKPIIPLTMAVMLGVLPAIPSFGAALSDYDAQTQEKLKDNVMEYDELEPLVAVYNPSMKSANNSIAEGIHELTVSIDDLGTNAGELERTAEDMKEAGNMAGYEMYKKLADGTNSAVKKMKESRDNITSHTNTQQIRSLEYVLTSGAQSMMIMYQNMAAQEETAAKAKELAEAAYQTTLTQKDLNMATDTDVLKAKKSLDQAVSGLAKIDGGLLNIKQNLCMMTGWSYDASPDIRPVPAVDQARLDAMDLDADTAKAIGNNTTLISQRGIADKARKTVKDKEKEKRARTMEESEQKVRMEMGQLYDAVQEKKTQAEGARAAYESAVTAKQTADIKSQVGALSHLEYLQAEVEFLSQTAAKESADMALLQAVNDYDWAVKGVLAIQ